MAKTFIMSLYKSSGWCKILLLILILLVFFIGFNNYVKKEGFINQKDKFTFKRGPEIFDDFYANIYDNVITDSVKDEYIVGKIINKTSPTSKSLLLDIGSGTGDIVSLFNQKNVKSIGLDNSTSMINISKIKYPLLEFNRGDATNIMIYPAHTFTHITCLNDTIYYFKDKKHLFKNIYEWLMPGGYFILQLDSNTKNIKLSNKKREVFTDFTYKIQNENLNGAVLINETFKDNEGKIRKQQHQLFIDANNDILKDIKNEGFIINGTFNLSPVNYDSKLLYIIYKPE
jgi:ubiquinone/menaquinone biosynthesis C-methylase UbiE